LTASPVASRFRRAGHHLAGVDADAGLDPELRERVAHLDGGTARAERVVLVHDGHAEHGHHGIADELLHGAAVPLDDALHPLEVAREQRPQRLWVGRVAQRRRPGDVAEEDRHRLPVLARRRRRDRRAALAAELRVRGDLVPAACASRHSFRLDRPRRRHNGGKRS